MIPVIMHRRLGCRAAAPGTSRRLAAAVAALLVLAGAVGSAQAVSLSLPHVEGAAGETVRIPVGIDAVSPDAILSGNLEIAFDAVILPPSQVAIDRKGTRTANWSLASNARRRPGGAERDGQLLIAAATASEAVVLPGVLFYIDVVVSETAAPGAVSPLSFSSVLLNNGEPVVVTAAGSLTVVAPRLRADFSGYPQIGMVPLEVQFQDLSSGDIDTWAWDFGDGGTSAEAGPRHTYELAGTYSVGLTVSGPSGQATETRTGYVEVTPDVVAPEIIEGPIARGVGHNKATAYWRTDEPANSEVIYCAVHFRPVWGNVKEVVAGLATELGDTEERVSELLQRGELRHFEELTNGQHTLTVTCERVVDEALVLKHDVRLTGLSPFTIYVYRVRSTDGDGNSSVWRGGYFVTHGRPDEDPPRIVLGPRVTAAPQRALIYWETDEPSNSFVQYSPNADYSGDIRVTGAELVTAHEVWLEGLTAGATYYYRVRSTDGDGNISPLKAGRFQTPVDDDDPPQILAGPRVSHRSATMALIWWTTDEASTSRVEYGLSEDYGRSVEEGDLVQEHLLFVSNLTPRTAYHFRVVSEDAGGNRAVSADQSLVTGAESDTRPPGLVRPPYLVKRHHDRVTFCLELDEEVRGQVEYGTTSEYGQVLELAHFRRQHTVTLGGLAPSVEYHCRAYLVDVAGNGPLTTADFVFRTAPSQDRQPPVIEGGPWVRSRSDRTITVAWQTDEASDSFVDFGRTAAYGSATGSPELVQDHVVTLTNLEPGTAYRLRVYSNDADGNGPTYSADQAATTSAAADRQRPRFLSGPEVVARAPGSAVIEWVTDEATDTFVDYGTSITYGMELPLDDFARRHRLVLPQLSPATTYHYQVTATDRAGNEPAVSRDLSFTTPAAADDRPPRLYGVAVAQVTATTALVEWRTDEPADGYVDFGAGSGYGQSAGSSDLGRQHQVLLAGLAAGQTYHYRVRSTDLAGNSSAGEDLTLRTNQQSDNRPPVVVEGPEVIVSHATATFAWRTDEPCFGSVVVGTDGTLGTAGEVRFEEEQARGVHRVTVTGLVAGTRYYFAVVSRDLSGNERVLGNRRQGSGKVVRALADAGEISFVTSTEVDASAPVFAGPPQVLATSDREVVIGWTTDEVSDARIYLVQGGSQTVAAYEPDYDFGHRLLLGNLEPATTYAAVAASGDPAGNSPALSASFTFTTAARPDAGPPRFTSPPAALALGSGTVALGWTTDEAATSTVVYGVGALDRQIESPDAATEHRVELTNLEPGVTYRYQAKVMDAFGNGPTSWPEGTFTVAAAADQTPPRILAGPTLVRTGDRSARVTWTTDEAADGFVYFGTGEQLDRVQGRATLERVHTVDLTNLTAGTSYRYKVTSADGSGNGPTESAIGAVTTAAADRVA
ncbi:MAG: fibronectin type III domain-containing protein, partial [Gemmatimonadota bacterium]